MVRGRRVYIAPIGYRFMHVRMPLSSALLDAETDLGEIACGVRVV